MGWIRGNLNIKKITVLALFSILILSGVVAGNIPSSLAISETALSPNGVSPNFNTWNFVGAPTKQAAVATNDDDASYIVRQADAKRQTFSFPTNQIPAGAQIASVTINAMLKRMGSLESQIQFSVEIGTKSIERFDSPFISTPNPSANPEDDPYFLRSFTMTTNPLTGAAWTNAQVNDMKVNGKNVFFGLNNQLRQGSEIRVTQLWIVVDWIDNVKPVTSAAKPNPDGNDPWHKTSPVPVTLTCNDPSPGSGCASTFWSLDGGALQSATSSDGVPLAPINISGDGVHTLNFYSTDADGNQETTKSIMISIDTTDPNTVADIPIADGANGWHITSPVDVTLACNDATSGCSSTTSTLNGVEFTSGENPTTVQVSAEGENTLSYHSTDVAGNVEDENTAPSIFIDTVDPVASITINGVTSAQTTQNDVTVQVSCSDATSGCASAAVDTDGDGTFDTPVTLDENNSGQINVTLPPGRGTTTMSVQVTDNAGRTGTDSASVELFATFDLTAGPSPTQGEWGLVPTEITTEHTNALDTDQVRFDGGSPPEVTVPADSSGTTTGSLTYPKDTVGVHTPSACLVDADGIIVEDIDGNQLCDTADGTFTVLKHQTEFLNFQAAGAPEGNEASGFGTLFDTSAQTGVDDALAITFSLSPDPVTIPDATTGTVTIEGASAITGNVLHLPEGASINTPNLPTYVKLLLAGMGSAHFEVQFDVGLNTYTFQGNAIDDEELEVSLLLSGGDPSSSPGISRIVVTDVENDGTFGVQRLVTMTAEQDVVDDITFEGAVVEPVMSFAGGGFLTRFLPPPLDDPLVAEIHTLTASFAGDSNYFAAADVSEQFSVSSNTGAISSDPTSTSAVTVVADAGSGVLSVICKPDKDDDQDALCNNWETQGGVTFVVGSDTLRYPIPNANKSVKNLVYEIDYMGAPHLPRSNALTDMQGVFSTNAITLDFIVSESIPHVNTIVMWTDNGADSDLDGNPVGDDFDSIKRKWYGSADERVTIASGIIPTFSGSTISVPGISITTPARTYDTAGNAVTTGAIKTQGTITVDVDVTTPIPTLITAGVPTIASGSTSGITILGITATVNPTDDPNTNTVTFKIDYRTDDAGTYTLANVDSVLSFTPSTTISSTTLKDSKVSSTLMDARKQFARYIVNAHSMGGPSGWAELLGNDIGIFLGVGFTGNTSFEDGSPHVGTRGSRVEQSAAIMHEIGHNLNLNHGGPNTLLGSTVLQTNAQINCKPFYLSLMSYSRIYPFFFSSSTAWSLDYSSGQLTAFNLVEDTLTEDLSLTTPAGKTVIWGGTNPLGVIELEEIAINSVDTDFDWNHNNIIDGGTVSKDINNFGIQDCLASPSQTLQDYNDWANLNFKFRDTPSGAFDAPNGRFIAEVNEFILDTQKIVNAFYFGPVPPLEITSTQKAGTNHPVKVAAHFTTQDEFDNEIDVEIVGDPADGDVVAVATIQIIQATNCDPNTHPNACVVFTNNDTPMEWDLAQHFHADWKSSKNQAGQTFIVRVFLAHPDTPTTKSLLTTDPQLLFNGQQPATMIIHLVP